MIYFSGNSKQNFPTLLKIFAIVVGLILLTGSIVHAEPAPMLSLLSSKEKQWLSNHKKIRVGYDGNFAPYSFINEKGEIVGIAVDFMNSISELLGVELVASPTTDWQSIYKAAKNHQLDMVATMVNRPDRHPWFNFTQPYLTKSLVIVVKNTNPALKTRTELSGKRVALPKGYEYTARVEKEVPGLIAVPVESMKAGFTALQQGEVDAAISFMATTSYLQMKYGFDNLKIAGFYERDSANESIAVRSDWPILATILQKALDNLTEEQKQLIYAKWMPQVQPVAIAATTPVARPSTLNPFNSAYLKRHERLLKIIVGTLATSLVLLVGGLTIYRQRRQIRELTENITLANWEVANLRDDLKQLIQERAVEVNSVERKFRNLLENLKQEYFFYQRNQRGKFTYVSPAVKTVLGYTPNEFMLNYAAYLTDNSVNRRLKRQNQFSILILPSLPYEIEIYDSRKAIRWLEIIDKPVFDDYGNCIGTDSLVHDITLRKQRELQEFKQLSAKLREPSAGAAESRFKHRSDASYKFN